MTSFQKNLFVIITISAAMGFVLGAPSIHVGYIETARTPNDDGITQSGIDAAGTAVDEGTIGDKTTSWSNGRDGSDANAEEHWRKHGREFSEDHSAQEYEDDASSFVSHPPPSAEIRHRANGDTLIYDPSTNTFAVEDRGGNPRTMFKPDHGEAYWDKQH